jgi:hypothetical protein
MKPMKILMIITAVLGLLLALWMSWGGYVIYTTERPPYQILQSLSSRAEIRQYEAQTWISTDYMTDDSSFRILASYIFGGNRENQRVAMTAPVITDDKMAFILPAGVTRESAPRPDGQAIEFMEVPPRKLATFRFSWTTSPERVKSKTDELIVLLEENGIRTSGQPFLMRYNDPWTPPFMRRNEIAIEVE